MDRAYSRLLHSSFLDISSTSESLGSSCGRSSAVRVWSRGQRHSSNPVNMTFGRRICGKKGQFRQGGKSWGCRIVRRLPDSWAPMNSQINPACLKSLRNQRQISSKGATASELEYYTIITRIGLGIHCSSTVWSAMPLRIYSLPHFETDNDWYRYYIHNTTASEEWTYYGCICGEDIIYRMLWSWISASSGFTKYQQ
jgi:hypothetical protein